MSDTTFELDENETPTSYSSSTPAPATNRKAVTAPGAGTGRRKEAVARVRLVPGTGRWLLTASHLKRTSQIRFTSSSYLSHSAQ